MANDVFGLAAQQSSWLLARQRVVAQNVANANTPGYKTVDLKPFEATLQSASMQLAVTSPAHISLDSGEAETATAAGEAESDEIYRSGNDVSQEQEMGKVGAIYRAYALNTAVVKAFNSMVLQAVKG